MNTTTAQKTIKKDDTVAVSRKEYEQFVQFKKIKEFKPTSAQKRALAKAEEDSKKEKTLSYDELVKKLGFGSRS